MAIQILRKVSVSGGTVLRAANNLGDVGSFASARANLGVYSQAEVAAQRNALAPRGGLAFDGTASAKALATLTNQNITTDDFALSLVLSVPSTLPNFQSLVTLGSSSSSSDVANAFQAYFVQTTGDLRVHLNAADASNYRRALISGFCTTYAGKTIHLVFTRTGGVLTIYVNGVSVAYTESTLGTPPTNWSGSVTSTYLLVANNSASYPYIGRLYSYSFYNVNLAQADVTEIYEIGGAVPEQFKFGSQVNDMAGNDATFAGAGNWSAVGTTVATVTGGQLVVTGLTNSGSNCMLSPTWSQSTTGAKRQNRRYRITFDVIAVTLTGGATLINVFSPVFSNSTPIGTFSTTGTKTFDFDYVSGGSNANAMLSFYRNEASGTCNVTLDNVSVKTIGAVVHYDADLDGIGYQLHDQSTNKLDATITTTGASWTKQARRGYVRGTLTWAGTHELKSLLGQRCIPNDARWDAISVKATAGSSGSGIRFADASDTYSVAIVSTFTTAKKPIAIIASNVFPGGTSDNNCNLSVDPDTANYTGSIAIEAQYSLTEGNP